MSVRMSVRNLAAGWQMLTRTGWREVSEVRSDPPLHRGGQRGLMVRFTDGTAMRCGRFATAQVRPPTGCADP